ncbi:MULTISPECIES: FAD-dependent oxidoreductase [unclassified Luteococcus]|uniref:FAD-dependent oxidoreductase n=1 Tax=unclassified Luteococcus TaxID=2639923 RepID=UPI00313ECCA4
MNHQHSIVIGGGATGGLLALRSAQAGHRVTLIDPNPTLGGLTATERFTVNGQSFDVDRFYHVILESDERVLALLDELGLTDTVGWTSAPAEIIARSVRYPATSLVDMVRLPMLKATDRARIGASIAASLALPMPLANRMTSVEWLRRTAGGSALESFWWPILRAKLGTQADRVSAAFLVGTFRRLVRAKLKGSGDRFGVLPNGYGPVFDALATRIGELGGEIRTTMSVERVVREADGLTVQLNDGSSLQADRVFVTTPGPVTARLLPQLTAAERAQLTAAPYLGVVCGSFLLEQPPNDSYITYLVDDVQLTGVIGMHALLPPEHTGGASLVYLPHYCSPDDEWFALTDDQVRDRMLAGLRQAFPDFEPTVLASSINRARHVVPLPVPGAESPLPFQTSIQGVTVVCTAQSTSGTLNVESSLDLAERGLETTT